MYDALSLFYCAAPALIGVVEVAKLQNAASLVCILPINAGRMWTDLHS